MAKTKDTQIRDDEGFIVLDAVPNGPFAKFAAKYVKKTTLPKDIREFNYTLTDINGNENIVDMAEVDIGDYTYGKGIIHMLNMNVGRNIPRIEDGLKPVERRALYVMRKRGWQDNNTPKVATVVGAMIEMVYPHGEASPADTIFRIGRRWAMMLPYVQAEGNYGNMEDFRPAASRYAETGLSEYAKDCFFKEEGKHSPLYDDQDTYSYQGREPIFLISRYPNILMQWNLGIGKGSLSWLGAFNSIDLLKTALEMMDDPNVKVDIYPDAPVPIDIINKAELKGCFDRDKFNVRMRAPYHLEVDQYRVGNKVENKYTIVYTALPLGVNGDQVKSEIKKLKANGSKKFQEITNIDVEVSDDYPGGIRFIVTYVNGYDPHALAEKLYKSTSLEKSISVQYVLTVGYRTTNMTPREIMIRWINQRYDQKRRYFHQMAVDAARRKTLAEGLAIALHDDKSIDTTIKCVRSSNKNEESIAKLKKEFSITEYQAEYIIKIPLNKLQKIDLKEVIRDRDEAVADYKRYRKLLASDNAIKEAIKDDLREGLKKHAKGRIAKLKTIKANDSIGDPTGRKYILYNQDYYYAMTDIADLKDIYESLDTSYKFITVRNSDTIMIFDSAGSMKLLNGYAFSTSKSAISTTTLDVKNAVSIVVDSPDSKNDSIVMVTALGYGKIMDMIEVTKSTSKIKTIKLGEGDSLVSVIAVSSDYHPDSIIGMISGSTMYYAKLIDFARYKKASAGNRILKNLKGKTIESAVYLQMTDKADYLLMYGEGGYLKFLDTGIMGFSKRGLNAVTMGDKNILGALLIHDNGGDFELYNNKTTIKHQINIQVDDMIRFKTSDGEDKKFKMSTSIGAPTRVLKVNKNDWYTIINK